MSTTNTTKTITLSLASTTQYLTQHQQPDVAPSVCRWPIAAGKRPVPIPNPEAKPANADGTATGRLWESKKPPTPNNNKQLNTTSPSPLSNDSTVTGFSVVLHTAYKYRPENTDLQVGVVKHQGARIGDLRECTSKSALMATHKHISPASRFRSIYPFRWRSETFDQRLMQ